MPPYTQHETASAQALVFQVRSMHHKTTKDVVEAVKAAPQRVRRIAHRLMQHETAEEIKAAIAGAQAIVAIRDAIAKPEPGTIMDHDLLHAERMTRLAVHHAFKARPDLRPPDAYSEAKAAAERRR